MPGMFLPGRCRKAERERKKEPSVFEIFESFFEKPLTNVLA